MSGDSLLDVLDLLTDLLDLGLEVDDHLCNVRILALGADGVRLAVELLNEEVRLAADRDPDSSIWRSCAMWLRRRTVSSSTATWSA